MGFFKSFSILLLLFCLFFGCLLPQYLTEARPMFSSTGNKDSTEVAHPERMPPPLNDVKESKQSGPSPGDGNASQDWKKGLGGMGMNSGPSPGEGHRLIIGNDKK